MAWWTPSSTPLPTARTTTAGFVSWSTSLTKPLLLLKGLLEFAVWILDSFFSRRFDCGKIKIWSCDIFVDWADPEEEPDEDTMSRVKILYCRNLTQAVTEAELLELFER